MSENKQTVNIETNKEEKKEKYLKLKEIKKMKGRRKEWQINNGWKAGNEGKAKKTNKNDREKLEHEKNKQTMIKRK